MTMADAAEQVKPTPEGASSDLVWRLATALTGLMGLGTLIAIAAGAAWEHAKIPPAPHYANLGAALLDLLIAWGLWRRSRAAWAFALSIWGTLLLINLLAAPRLLEAGAVGALSLAFAAVRTVTGMLLIARRRNLG